MEQINLKFENNYNSFKEDFKKDTGLDPKQNVAEYISYFNARVSDLNRQFNYQIALTIINKINLMIGKKVE